MPVSLIHFTHLMVLPYHLATMEDRITMAIHIMVMAGIMAVDIMGVIEAVMVASEAGITIKLFSQYSARMLYYPF
jgi:hypothetical protein